MKFDVCRVENGAYAGKGYLIITHARDKCLDIRNGSFEEGQVVHQAVIRESESQLWLIESVSGNQEYRFM